MMAPNRRYELSTEFRTPSLSEKTLYSLGRRCVYIFNRRKAKKEIPVNS